MRTYREYGKSPFNVAILHGGPGAPGEMAPVARELSAISGIIEPLQAAASINGQVEELKGVIVQKANLPIILIGFSWGAMLGFIFTARYPEFVRKLILVSSGAFEEKYAEGIMAERLVRLSQAQRIQALNLIDALNDPGIFNKAGYMHRFAALMFKADSCNPLPHKSEILEYQYETNRSIWKQASELRKSGALLAMGKRIGCPVMAIHGDCDPHPAEGVKIPLESVLKDFDFTLIQDCGHYPWLERKAKDKFYQVLKDKIKR